MCDEHVFDLLRVDVHAAADDHVSLAVGQVQVAVLVEVADIAERGPATGQLGIGRLLGSLVVLECAAAGEVHAADLAGAEVIAIVVADVQATDPRLTRRSLGARATPRS